MFTVICFFNNIYCIYIILIIVFTIILLIISIGNPQSHECKNNEDKKIIMKMERCDYYHVVADGADATLLGRCPNRPIYF